ncbi:PPC domain-containing protein [candidate division KSB1 bacterium]|nr:PPC domain-containing protein [candidate division KSB1 bacterium]
MTKKMLWYVFLGLLCCGLGAAVLSAKVNKTSHTVVAGSVAEKYQRLTGDAALDATTPVSVGNKVENLDEMRARQAQRAQVNPVSVETPKLDVSALELQIAELEAQLYSPSASDQDAVVPMDVKLRLGELYALRPENQRNRRSLDQGVDACPGTVIPSVPYSDSGTTVGYVNNYTTCGANTSPDVIYEFTPTTTTQYILSMCGSSYDSRLEVRSSGACPGTVQNGCNDDFCGLQSQLTLALTAGTTYFVIVDGYATSSGAYVLNITELTPCVITCQGGDVIECAAQGPDSTTQATDCNGGCNNSSGTPLFQNINCGETVCGTGFTYLTPGGLQYRDTDWYMFTIAAPCTVRVSARAEFPVLVGIVNNVSPCAGPAFVASASNANLCSTTVATSICLAAGTYAAFVSPNVFTGYATPAEYRVTLTCSAPCAPCVPDLTLAAPGSISGSTCGAGDNCNLRAGEDVTVAVTIPTAGNWTFSLCDPVTNWDSYMYVTTACCGGTVLAQDDDACPEFGVGLSLIPSLALAAGTYYVDIEPFSAGVCSTWTLVVSQPAPCAPLYLATAPFTQASPGTSTTNTCNLTAGPDETWEITIPNDGEWTFTLCPTLPATWDSYIRLSTTCCGTSLMDADGSPCDGVNLSEITCIALTQGVYYLSVEDWNAAALSAYTLQVFECLPCSVACAGGALIEGEACDPTIDVVDGGCNYTPFLALNLACGTTYCGNIVANDTIRDTDWYAVNLATAGTITVTAQAERAFSITIIDTTCGGCPASASIGSGSQVACSTLTVVSQCVPAGTYFVVILPTNFPTLCSDYNITAVCDPCVPCDVVSAGTPEAFEDFTSPTFPDDDPDGGCNNLVPTYGAIACGEHVAGRIAVYNAGANRDTDWYQITLADSDSLNITVNPEWGLMFTYLLAGDYCTSFGIVAGPAFSTAPCVPYTLTTGCIAAGTYIVFVSTQDWTGPFCAKEYDLFVECSPCGTPCPDIYDLTALPYNHRFNANPSNPPDSLLLTWSVPDSLMIDSVIIYSADGAYPTVDPPSAPWVAVETVLGASVTGNSFLRKYVDVRPLSVLPSTPGVPKTRFYNVVRKYCFVPPPPPPPQAEERCPGTALSGALPITVTNNTLLMANDYTAVGLGAAAPACWLGFYSETTSCAGPDGAYDWTAPATATYTISLAGSTFDTCLLIYTYTCPTEPVNPTDYLCGNDDSVGLQSQINNLSLTAGQRVLIVVDGYGTSSGTYTLTISTP